VWLEQQGCRLSSDCCFRSTAGGGHLDVLRWLREIDRSLDFGRCCAAAAWGGWGHLGVIEWLRGEGGRGYLWDSECCKNAATNGDPKLLRWALANGCSYDPKDKVRDGYLFDFRMMYFPTRP
jgi:hypothetical protein